MLCTKLSKIVGILNKLKSLLPLCARMKIYNSLFMSHLNYGILLWGVSCDRLNMLQKRAIRILTNSNFISHTEPLFKSLNTLKLCDIFNLAQIKFLYKHANLKLPKYLANMSFTPQPIEHGYNTRQSNYLYFDIAKHEFANKSFRYYLPKFKTTLPENVLLKFNTHNFKGLVNYVKNSIVNNYSMICMIPDSVCWNRNQGLHL